MISSLSWAEIAARITNPISLAAYSIAALVWIVARANRRGGKPVPNALWYVISALVLVPNLTPAFVDVVRMSLKPTWRVRATVLDPRGVPVENARVWSTLGGETKRVAGGWEIDVASDSRPADGRLTVFAQVESAFETGQESLILGDDHSPSLIVSLQREDDATIAGTVIDRSGLRVPDAVVYVDGYESESTKTTAGISS